MAAISETFFPFSINYLRENFGEAELTELETSREEITASYPNLAVTVSNYARIIKGLKKGQYSNHESKYNSDEDLALLPDLIEGLDGIEGLDPSDVISIKNALLNLQALLLRVKAGQTNDQGLLLQAIEILEQIQEPPLAVLGNLSALCLQTKNMEKLPGLESQLQAALQAQAASAEEGKRDNLEFFYAQSSLLQVMKSIAGITTDRPEFWWDAYQTFYEGEDKNLPVVDFREKVGDFQDLLNSMRQQVEKLSVHDFHSTVVTNNMGIMWLILAGQHDLQDNDVAALAVLDTASSTFKANMDRNPQQTLAVAPKYFGFSQLATLRINTKVSQKAQERLTQAIEALSSATDIGNYKRGSEYASANQGTCHKMLRLSCGLAVAEFTKHAAYQSHLEQMKREQSHFDNAAERRQALKVS